MRLLRPYRVTALLSSRPLSAAVKPASLWTILFIAFLCLSYFVDVIQNL